MADFLVDELRAVSSIAPWFAIYKAALSEGVVGHHQKNTLVYRLSRQHKMLEVVPSLTRHERSAITHKLSTRFLHKSSHIIFQISCATSIDAFVLLHKHFISSLYVELLHSPTSRTNLSYRRAGLPTLCKDSLATPVLHSSAPLQCSSDRLQSSK